MEDIKVNDCFNFFESFPWWWCDGYCGQWEKFAIRDENDFEVIYMDDFKVIIISLLSYPMSDIPTMTVTNLG